MKTIYVNTGRLIRALSAVILLAVAFPYMAFADRVTELTPSSARARAMGGAGINTLDDFFAAYYNPANLANKRVKPRFELLNLQLDADIGFVNAMGSLYGNPMSVGDAFKYMEANPGQWVNHRYAIAPNFTSRFFTFGLLYEASYGGKFDLAPLEVGGVEKFTTRGYRRVAPTATASFRMFGGVLKFGYTLMLDYLGVVDVVVNSPRNKTLSWTDGMQEGVGVRHIGGFTLTLPFAHLPSFSVVARDILSTPYFGGSLSRKNPMMIDFGFGYVTHFGKVMKLRLTADYRDYTKQLQMSAMRRVFSGLEIDFGNKIKLRGGYGQGYPSAGLGFWLKKAKVDFSWYSEEVGNRLRDHRDQRFLMQWSWATID